MKRRGIENISLFFLSHSDSDHSGGADRIIREFEVGSVYLPDSSAKLSSLKAAARENGCNLVQCSRNDCFMIGNTEFTVLSPSVPLSGDENSDSLVISVKYGSTSVLFMGDADVAAEERIMEYYGSGLPACNLIKLGHHGALTSSSEAFLCSVSPQYAVISCGKGNDYGHPHAKVLTVLKNLGIKAFRTDIDGELTFISDGNEIYPSE